MAVCTVALLGMGVGVVIIIVAGEAVHWRTRNSHASCDGGHNRWVRALVTHGAVLRVDSDNLIIGAVRMTGVARGGAAQVVMHWSVMGAVTVHAVTCGCSGLQGRRCRIMTETAIAAMDLVNDINAVVANLTLR